MSFKSQLSSDPLMLRQMFSGQYQVPTLYSADTTTTLTARQMQFVPFTVGVGSGIMDRIGLEVSTVGAGNARLGIYSDSAGRPANLLQDAGAFMDLTVASYQEAIVNWNVGIMVRLWLAILPLLGSSGSVRARANNPLFDQSNITITTNRSVYGRTIASDSFPSDLTSVGGVTSINAAGPKILTRFT